MTMIGFIKNGIYISVQKWDNYKKPVLTVSFDDENVIYKVASFNDVETANWFCEILDEVFKGDIDG